MNIFRHELKQNRGATISWIIGILALSALYISLYPSVAANPDISKILKNFPEAFKRAFGMTDNACSFFPSLYALVLNFVLLVGAVQAMNLGTGIISKEVRDKTAEFLLSKPVKRFNILSQKLFSALILIVITNVIYLVATWALIKAIIEDPFQLEAFIVSSLSLLFVQVFFLCLGFLIGIVLAKIRSVIAITLPTVFGFYIIGLLDTVIGEEKIKYLTPFRLFDLIKLTTGSSYQAASCIYLSLLIALLTIVSYMVYQKKDIQTI